MLVLRSLFINWSQTIVYRTQVAEKLSWNKTSLVIDWIVRTTGKHGTNSLVKLLINLPLKIACNSKMQGSSNFSTDEITVPIYWFKITARATGKNSLDSITRWCPQYSYRELTVNLWSNSGNLGWWKDYAKKKKNARAPSLYNWCRFP